MPDEPVTLGEVSRRLDEQARRVDEGFRDINARLSEMPTEKTLLAYLATHEARMQAVADDVKDLGRELGQEKADRKVALAAFEDRLSKARTLTLAAVGTCATVTLGVAGLVLNLGGGA